jgi:hypothetical protein
MNKTLKSGASGSLADRTGTTFDVIEIALLAGVEGAQRGGAPLRGFARTLAGHTYRLSRKEGGGLPTSITAVRYVHEGVEGAVLVRKLGAYAAGGGQEERWFVPFSAFGDVANLSASAIRVD